jgi:pimeloyl-ACP methyl ester carboxylesterase
MWRPVAEMLAERFRLVMPDLRGHGESELGSSTATMEKHAEDLRMVCVDARVERAIFAGVSIGGYILFEYWRRHRERVKALVLANTRASADTEDGRKGRMQSIDELMKFGPEPFVEKMLEKVIGETTRRNRLDIVDAARTMMKKMTAKAIAEVQRGMAERPDSVATLGTIDVPALVITSDEDGTTPLKEAEIMRKGISRAEMKVIPRAGHYAVFERSDAAFELLMPFLQKQT